MDRLTLNVAEKIMATILARAKSDGKRPISVAVVDDRGDLILFARMDGTPVRSIRIAVNKAYTAARVGRDTVLFRKKVEKDGNQISWFGDPKLTGLSGGVALEVGGKVAGGIGVSGRAAEEDHELGEIGRSAIA
jgi:uncharacterized protein GlcG (DUF336 family)